MFFVEDIFFLLFLDTPSMAYLHTTHCITMADTTPSSSKTCPLTHDSPPSSLVSSSSPSPHADLILFFLLILFVIHVVCRSLLMLKTKIWKMKIPLKTKKLGWYLCRGVIITKDNLAKRNWYGSSQYVFCHKDETIKHLFFQCRFARSIRSIIQVASSMYPPTNIANLFRSWLHGIDLIFRTLIKVGTLAVIWLLWLCRK
jgi:hypothetical protein